MKIQFFTLILFISALFTAPVFSQCITNSCTNSTILKGTANWVDGIQGLTNGILTVSEITLSNIECSEGGAGIEIYIYQLLPDGSRIALCNVPNEAPDNFVFKFTIDVGAVSDCTNTALLLPNVIVADHEGGESENPSLLLCDGGMYEVIMVAYVLNGGQTLPAEQTVYTALNDNQYVETNLGTFFVNYTNEFATPNPFPIPITTAAITGPNGETGMMTANCNDEVNLFFEGLSYIGRCRANNENLPNFYPFCDPLDPTMANGIYSPSITSETENFITYTVNGETPIIIRNGNGGDPATDAYGGQQTGPGNLPGLSANECFTGLCGTRAISAPSGICSGDVLVVSLQTLDIFSGLTAEDELTITYQGDTCGACASNCPTQANISISEATICSGESLTIFGTSVGEGATIFNITETTSTVTNITEGIAFLLPENNTCTPVNYTFTASAICASTGDEINEGNLSVEVTVYPSDISSFISTVTNNCISAVNIATVCGDNLTVSPSSQQLAEVEAEGGTHQYTVIWTGGGDCVPDTNITLDYTCDCIFDSTLTELELVSGSTQVCYGSSIEYKAKYNGLDVDLAADGGIDESYNAAFIIFIEPIDFNQPPQTEDALYRITNETKLVNDESIEPGTYYIYYFQGTDVNDPINDEAPCMLYSQEFLMIDILPEISSGEAICTGFDNSNVVTIAVTDEFSDSLPTNGYVENNGIQYPYSSIEIVDGTKILSFVDLPDGFYFFYYEDAQNCTTTTLRLEFDCASQPYDCPTDLTIEPVAAQCSEATINLSANIVGLSEFTTVNWFDAAGNRMEDPTMVMLPLNEQCDPVEAVYTVEVGCSQDPDFVTLSDMVTVIVYPSDISAFVSPVSDGCFVSVLIADVCTANNITAESQMFDAGESGTTNIMVSYPGNICIDDFTISVTYECPTDAGCTDPCAPNYDANATVDDNNCTPYNNICNDDCTTGNLTLWDEATCSCITGVETINGCTDAAACNYNAAANCDDGSCQTLNCNTDACAGDIETPNPANACACIVAELQNVGCDDPSANNYDATVNCADNSTCDYTIFEINISDPCFCENEMNIDLDEDGTADLVADIITINGAINDTWRLTSNGTPPVLDAQNRPLITNGTISTIQTSPGVYTVTVYHAANGAGYGTITFSSDLGYTNLQITNTNGCNCAADCVPPNAGSFECGE